MYSELYRKLEQQRRYMLGYPLNLDSLDWSGLSPALNFVLNNLGEPYSPCRYGLNTLKQERAVVSFFSSMFHLANGWGYVTNSGSESNMQGLLSAREKFPNGVVYLSDKAHYSFFKAAKTLSLPVIVVATNDNHAINIEDFFSKLKVNKPAIVGITVGTTMAGAIDNA